MAGTGVGTFYNYFSSKEQLFLEVYLDENQKIKKQIIESLDTNDDPITLVQKFLTQSFEAARENKILNAWYHKDIFPKLDEYFRKNIKTDGVAIRSFFAERFQQWQAEGKVRTDIDEDLMLALFDSLAYIELHKEDIGIQHFPQIIHYLVEFIMKGITDNRN